MYYYQKTCLVFKWIEQLSDLVVPIKHIVIKRACYEFPYFYYNKRMILVVNFQDVRKAHLE